MIYLKKLILEEMQGAAAEEEDTSPPATVQEPEKQKADVESAS